ncbi:MAG TPA: hypothetical protein VGR25_05960 [bacterium]|jgi:hypothetical protein|nr:hypothetical protein [bacterium]
MRAVERNVGTGKYQTGTLRGGDTMDWLFWLLAAVVIWLLFSRA